MDSISGRYPFGVVVDRRDGEFPGSDGLQALSKIHRHRSHAAFGIRIGLAHVLPWYAN
jgi:hypothetical protein